ncbi:tRNA (adenosine(37)-N6)-dimethylallyltransferase MiaA [Patescibacteria group bacterium]|nr:tRNA (adenosine(37)-N6)-dimethylallyltransferase MiaA [Patescibacteria group bacterium]
MSSKTRIICVIGPTASGKTAKAVALAKERDGEVISVDSRQVYRMLDIGTEKATKEEMDGIPHYLIDAVDPREIYSAGDFVTDANSRIADIAARGKTPILAGGTHFYFDALLNGLPKETPADPEFRKTLEALSDEELFARIQAQDPRRAEKIDPHNRRRLTRALEVIQKHGQVPERTPSDTYEVEWVVLMPEREELRARLEKRLKDAFAKGLIEEVRQVREYVGDERLNELGLEYKVIGEYLREERTEESLIPALTAKLWQYAKHQMKWMRKLRLPTNTA